MRDLFKLEWKAIGFGVLVFVVAFALVTVVANILVNANISSAATRAHLSAAMDVAAYIPFLAAGHMTSLRAHPAGVFNGAIVGVFGGMTMMLVARFAFGVNHVPSASLFAWAAAIATSMSLCALGGVLGTIVRHFRARRA